MDDPDGNIVIVGSGLAGLFTALKLAPLPVTVISAAPLGKGTSSGWAQGGIAAAVSEGDSPEAHALDTIRAGAGIVDEHMARLLASEAAARIEDLLRYGVPFDKDLEGRLLLSREAAHSARRIIRVKGDLAGKAIMESVTAAARATPSIRVLEGYVAQDIATSDGRVSGVSILPVSRPDIAEPVVLPAKALVLASGGIGQVFAVTTNPRHARGSGLAMAARAGAVIADAEFVQFHPTALNIGLDPAPLATEALRGEGATLINASGERFMVPIHDDAELAPRDIVARGVFRELQAGRGAFLDCRGPLGRKFADSFPGIFAVCRNAGLDPASEPLPVAPAAHYHMGGVLTDANGRTTLDGLWACGEVASTGAHGANRLASNSLLETVVFGARIAEDVHGLFRHERLPTPAKLPGSEASRSGPQQSSLIARIRNVMGAQAGVIRNHDGLVAALKELDAIARDPETARTAANMALAARFVVAAALLREESRGGHFRSDFPEARDTFARRSYLRLEDVDSITASVCEGDTAVSNVIRADFGS